MGTGSGGFDWNHARVFLVTAAEGSFSGAARALASTQPTVGRQVAALERELGVTLFERVGGGLALTTAGLELLDHVRAMDEAAGRVALAATGQASALDGVVCVTASEVISAHLLPPIVAEVRAAHPGIEIELVASNQVSDLHRREADIAIRNFRPRQPELVARRIQDGFGHLYAAPAYLASIGDPQTPADLARAVFFGFDRTDLMVSGLNRLGLSVTAASFPIVSASHLVQWALCKQGLGICVMMDEVGDAEPAVRRVLPEVALPVPMWLVTHREIRTSRRIRVVFDLLADGLVRRCRGDTSGVADG